MFKGEGVKSGGKDDEVARSLGEGDIVECEESEVLEESNVEGEVVEERKEEDKDEGEGKSVEIGGR